jgi:hypothetical protein
MATGNKGSGKRTGAEQRRDPRRTSGDRRDQVRWEPDKKERRKGHGRRSTDGPHRRND